MTFFKEIYTFYTFYAYAAIQIPLNFKDKCRFKTSSVLLDKVKLNNLCEPFL